MKGKPSTAKQTYQGSILGPTTNLYCVLEASFYSTVNLRIQYCGEILHNVYGEMILANTAKQTCLGSVLGFKLNLNCVLVTFFWRHPCQLDLSQCHHPLMSDWNLVPTTDHLQSLQSRLQPHTPTVTLEGLSPRHPILLQQQPVLPVYSSPS